MARTKKSDAEQRRDPRWERKRLEIRQRDDCTCRDCGTTGHELQGHHTFSHRGLAPWEYPGWVMICLWEPCRAWGTKITNALLRVWGRFSITDGQPLRRVFGYAMGTNMATTDSVG
jgi:5-methylcytosine-specific restriction endonuclease McrA